MASHRWWVCRSACDTSSKARLHYRAGPMSASWSEADIDVWVVDVCKWPSSDIRGRAVLANSCRKPGGCYRPVAASPPSSHAWTNLGVKRTSGVTSLRHPTFHALYQLRRAVRATARLADPARIDFLVRTDKGIDGSRPEPSEPASMCLTSANRLPLPCRPRYQTLPTPCRPPLTSSASRDP